MNRKAVGLGVAAVALSFALGKMVARERRVASNGDAEAGFLGPAAERDAVRRFWQVYREATDHRVAGRADEAIGAYERALAINGGHEDALYHLGSMYLTAQRFDDAVRQWERLVEANPSQARGHMRLGDVRFCLDEPALVDLSGAAEQYRRAMEINGEETGPMLRLAEVAVVRGEPTVAREWLVAVIGSNPRSADAHYLTGYLLWAAGNEAAGRDWHGKAAQYATSFADDSVVGEGDTRVPAGSAAPEGSCRALERRIRIGIDSPASPYQAFHQWIVGVRARIQIQSRREPPDRSRARET